ncbi:MAG: nitrous oxide reductase accessory protein NosL [Proteobacteria bacterium]|nr:nitrous oxide reductase accessory protein NosL [Pseudomonadota bacterium]MBU4010942.1 nitrous oxide reductase accessory protein NosL [Pseudomonadota bacterium]
MRKYMICFMVCMVVCLVISGIVFAQDDIKKHQSCKYCGMDRDKFAHSRIFIEYDYGTTEGTCSLRCAAIDFAVNIDKEPKTIWVGDYNTKNLIDAEKAFWVIGGSRSGVMTKRAKWAFLNEEDAKEFVKEYGGKSATFDEAIKASYEDMYQDTKMVRKMRKLKGMIKHNP